MGAAKECTTLVGRTKRGVEAVTKEKAQRNTGDTTVRHGGKLGTKIPEGLGSWEQTPGTSKEDWKWQRGIPERK